MQTYDELDGWEASGRKAGSEMINDSFLHTGFDSEWGEFEGLEFFDMDDEVASIVSHQLATAVAKFEGQKDKEHTGPESKGELSAIREHYEERDFSKTMEQKTLPHKNRQDTIRSNALPAPHKRTIDQAGHREVLSHVNWDAISQLNSPQGWSGYRHPDAFYDQQLVLVGLEGIGRAVGAGPKTLRKWISREGFPARKGSDGVFRASPDAVKLWFEEPFSKRAR